MRASLPQPPVRWSPDGRPGVPGAPVGAGGPAGHLEVDYAVLRQVATDLDDAGFALLGCRLEDSTADLPTALVGTCAAAAAADLAEHLAAGVLAFATRVGEVSRAVEGSVGAYQRTDATLADGSAG